MLNKSKIEWTDYTWNPITGCLQGCEYCYARQIATRFAGGSAFPNGFEPTFHPERLADHFPRKSSKIFTCSMGELFGDWIPAWQVEDVFATIKAYPQHTFQLLTKQPQNLIRWSPFPENCWIGVSAIGYKEYVDALAYIVSNKASVKYISFEPLLSWDRVITNSFAYSKELGHAFNDRQLLEEAGVNWVIIGQQTPIKKTTMPKIGWIEEIVKAADKANIPVFLKDNLISCVDQYPFAFSGIFPDIKLRQEFPIQVKSNLKRLL